MEGKVPILFFPRVGPAFAKAFRHSCRLSGSHFSVHISCRPSLVFAASHNPKTVVHATQTPGLFEQAKNTASFWSFQILGNCTSPALQLLSAHPPLSRTYRRGNHRSEDHIFKGFFVMKSAQFANQSMTSVLCLVSGTCYTEVKSKCVLKHFSKKKCSGQGQL